MRLLFILVLLAPIALADTATWGYVPGSNHTATVQDTYLSTINESYHLQDELKLGTYPANFPASTILMKWDLSQLAPGTKINSAKLRLYYFANEPGTDGVDRFYDVSAHRIINVNPDISKATGIFYDGTNEWTLMPGTDGFSLGQKDIAPAESTTSVDRYFGYKEWPVAKMVQYWVDNPRENYGMLLRPGFTASSESNRIFASSQHSSAAWRPHLVIKYTACGSALDDVLGTLIRWKQGQATLQELLDVIDRWRA
jgi:hypothetical protein